MTSEPDVEAFMFLVENRDCGDNGLTEYARNVGLSPLLCMQEKPLNYYLTLLLAIIVSLPVAFALPIPGAGANQSYLFASPNTKESLSDEDAKVRLNSLEQIHATAVADRSACALTHNVRIADSLGIYDKSMENSFILKADLGKEQSEYLAALLGLYSHQEFILLFLDEPAGLDRMWIIKTPQSQEEVIATLRRLKLTPVTVRTVRDQNEIWFIDFGEKRAEDLKIFTSDVNGLASLTEGAAEMLGNPSRTKAIRLWRKKISVFEQRGERHLSVQLSSKGWRDATAVHTCSKEIAIP
jgi:hypothetical protein